MNCPELTCLRRIIVALGALLLVGTALHASAQDSASANDADRLALKNGVDALIKVVHDEENTDRVVFPVIRQTKIIDRQTEEFTVRYKKVIVTVPVYKNHYKTQEVIVPVKQGSITVMKKVTRKVLVRREQIGEKKVERLQRDPEGDIEKTHTRVKITRGPGGPDIETMNWTGRNAMALYALLEAGVDPNKVPALDEMATSLNGQLHQHGLPDDTFDLAWATAALSRYPGGRYHSTVQDLTGRLIAGQCEENEGRGLWGPVCVNSRQLKAVILEFERVQAAADKLKREGKLAKKGEEPGKLQLELQTAQEQVAWVFSLISRNGPWFSLATRRWTIQGAGEDVPGRVVAGWPYNAYQSTMVDLQSTALALFALRVAHEHNALPESFDFQKLRGVTDKPLARPMQTRSQLTQTLQTLSRMHDPRKGWDEGIVWQTNTTFARLNDTYKGQPVPIPKVLDSRATPICNAHAASALADLSILLGEQATARYQALAEDTRAKVGTQAQPVFEHLAALPTPALAAKALKKNSTFERYRAFAPVAGGAIEPYAYFEAMSLSPASIIGDEAKEAVYGNMVAWLIDQQQKDGLWPVLDELTWVNTPALRAYARVRVEGMLEEKVDRTYMAKTAVVGLLRISPATTGGNNKTLDSGRRLASIYAVLTLAKAGGPLEAYSPPVKDEEDLVVDE